MQIWGKLYWVNDTATTMQHNWHIHETAVSRGLGVYEWGVGVSVTGECEHLWLRCDYHSSLFPA